MSPLSFEQIRIGLAPQRVELVRIRRGLRSRTVLAANARDCLPESGQPLWAAALDALGSLLAEQPPGRTAVSVVLSNHFARYVLLPWQEELTGADEIAVAATQRFVHMFGEPARRWVVRCSQGDWGQPGIACAIDGELLAALGECIGHAGRRLASVQPLLMSAFNALRGELDPEGALAVVEPGRVCLGSFRNGQWQSIVSRRSGDPLRVIAQELAVAVAETPPSRLDLVDFAGDCRWPDDDALPARLHAAGGDGACRLAMVGSA